ncbi:HAMP domain-containing histidine kinase [Stappia sp. F7233]|uniref:histidine kinase n=2 Tax=Stappia albiluteola TaxID=2758565 RepID=A0A839AAX6_9HYPH|nr:HAMP domain-containing histidine kinase [Stappia albiluteola]
MLSEVMIYVPSIANFRNNWLNQRLTTAGVAATVLVETNTVTQRLQEELLNSTGAVAISLDEGSRRRLIAISPTPLTIDSTADMSAMSPQRAIAESFAVLLSDGAGLMRVVGLSQMGAGVRVDMVLPEKLLRDDMLAFSVRILGLSIFISAITATLVYFSLRWLFLRPMQRLTTSMARFAEAPDDASRIIVPSRRRDEIGDAESRLASMQETLKETLGQQRHLADLGLAVSKINHDLRNLLASAQLFSESLESIPDPTAKRLAPKIIAALDRAIGYTQSVLAYGRTKEAPPERRLVRLNRVVEDVGDILGLTGHEAIQFDNLVVAGIEVDADPEQLFRVLMNLVRNAMQALEAKSDPALVCRISVEGEREGGVVVIRVSDTGPGIPDRIRQSLFQPFQASTKRGGTGLGLAIAAELVRAHGGVIRHVDRPGPGTTFEIVLPDRAVDIGEWRERSRRLQAS